ncbi:MAG: LysM peptidoglycan-binding domain-containing protein [Gammaproteobacteria bacterium]|nr:LysM peptidoglycan-binding domain-containing protein [Gammaproteobacteria bacterium]
MPSYKHASASLILGLLLTWGAVAQADVAVNPTHPDRYTVVRGDTLWDIAGRFLRDPWRWPDVWHVNPQIRNPHLIYPGDVIVMSYVDGKLRLSLERGSLVKLSPNVRSSPLDAALPSVPLDAINQFLTRPFVLDNDDLDTKPYIVSFGREHLLGSTGVKAYVRSIEDDSETRFDVVRGGVVYRDADTNEILGYEAEYVGSADLMRTGDPATIQMTSVQIEAFLGDRLLPANEGVAFDTFFPKAPNKEIRGSIISVLNGVNEIGQYNVVVLDRGASDGLVPGDVLTINQRGETVRDVIIVARDAHKQVQLPDEPAGVLMVFRTFSRISFGLVMYASSSIHVKDRVVSPDL